MNTAPHIEWAIKLLKEQGHQIHTAIPDIIQDTPWAAVYRFTTDQGNIFLKKVPPALSLEPAIINLLHHDFHAHVPCTIAKNELIELHKLTPKLQFLLEQLSRYTIAETFGHSDFHDKNILIDVKTHEITLIDLGEITITHPFFSFNNCLHRAKENFALSDSQYRELQLACLKPWNALETTEHLLEIIAIIQTCWSIHGVLTEYQLMQSVDEVSFSALHRQGRLAKNLKHWINNQ